MINYQRLAHAQLFYQGAGYKVIEVPWVVDSIIDDITRPESKRPYSIDEQRLVASGEQSLMQLMYNGNLNPGKYQTITPCFRCEDEDEIHKKMFMKLELIVVLGDSIIKPETTFPYVHELQTLARQFFSSNGMDCYTIDTDEAHHSCDIMCSKTHIELGSYGMRQHPTIGSWVYGTGLAEPRFSYVLDQIRS